MYLIYDHRPVAAYQLRNRKGPQFNPGQPAIVDNIDRIRLIDDKESGNEKIKPDVIAITLQLRP
jgi:hypothetical protein